MIKRKHADDRLLVVRVVEKASQVANFEGEDGTEDDERGYFICIRVGNHQKDVVEQNRLQ